MKKKRILLLILLLLSVISVFVGISVSIFTFFGKGNTNNVIETGRIIFSYSDALKKGNGIDIKEAMPIKDEDGIVLSKENEYFDFSVSATTTSTDIAYEIVVNKDETSTLPDDMVKIYLTEIDGNSEKVVPLMEKEIPVYSALKDTTNNLLSGKSVYYGEVKAGEVAYGKKFRLRMWIKDVDSTTFDYETIFNKIYKVRVNVAAIGSK